MFSDFSYICHYCHRQEFSQRSTDSREYFEKRTSQFESLSLKVLSLFQPSNIEWIKINNYTTFEAIRNAVSFFRHNNNP